MKHDHSYHTLHTIFPSCFYCFYMINSELIVCTYNIYYKHARNDKVINKPINCNCIQENQSVYISLWFFLDKPFGAEMAQLAKALGR